MCLPQQHRRVDAKFLVTWYLTAGATHSVPALLLRPVSTRIEPRGDRVAVREPRSDAGEGGWLGAVSILQAIWGAGLAAPMTGRVDDSGVRLVADLLPDQQLGILRHGQADVAVERACSSCNAMASGIQDLCAGSARTIKPGTVRLTAW